MSIERMAKVVLMDGTEIPIPFDEKKEGQIWEGRLSFLCLDSATGESRYSGLSIPPIHIRREKLEEAGLLIGYKSDGQGKKVSNKTPEDLVIEFLEHLGVKFED